MKTILVITKNTDTEIQLYECESNEEAKEKIKYLYKEFCRQQDYDYHNTYINEELGYAQIVFGLEQIEFRIGQT